MIKKNTPKKSTKSLFESFKEKVQKQSALYYKKLEREKDEVKQFQIERHISKITIQVLLDEIKKMSNQEWIDFFNEFFSNEFSQADRVFDQMDVFAFNNVDAPSEYKKYEKIKKHYFKTNYEYGGLLIDADLDKKHLKRLLEFAFAVVGISTVANTQMILNWYEFLNAVSIVQRRLGFDHNWLMYMSLIQLHENLVKKKIVQLKGKIEKNEDMPSLISKLVSLKNT